MIKRTFLLGIVALMAALSQLAAAGDTAVLKDIRVTAGEEAAQVTLDLSRNTTYKLFTLQNPNRVVLDLQNTTLASDASIPKGSGVIEKVRTGLQPNSTLRVVFQVKSDVESKAHWVPVVKGEDPHLLLNLGEEEAVARTEEPRPVRAAHAPVDSDRPVVVAIDAGHGGQDPGAIGRSGTREKDVVLAIARALAKRINAEPGMKAVLTRERDEFLPLRDRIARARSAKADLFVSVHADSIRNRDVSGSSVYVLSERGATDEAARWLAERENAADLMGGVSLTDKDDTLASVLLDLSNSANISASMAAAKRVLNALDSVGEVRKPAVQQAGFVVLKSPDIPSMLVETAYISNPSEERRLRTSAHQAKLADAIFSGLRTHFEQNPPPGTRFAQARRNNDASFVLASPNAP